MLLDWVEEAITGAYRELAARVVGSRPKVVDPIVEAAALVAVADRSGEASSRKEQAETLNAVRQIANLDRLGLNHASRRFEQAKAELGANPERRREVLTRLASAELTEAEARLVLSVAGGVAAVDGHVSEAEKAALDDIEAALARDPEDQAAGR